jgi:hypothetical protein
MMCLGRWPLFGDVEGQAVYDMNLREHGTTGVDDNDVTADH